MKFVLTFTQDQIQPAKKTALEKLSKDITLKGFRQGKAPLDLVEQHINPEQLIEETASSLIPSAYSAYIVDSKLKPITQPKISLKKMAADGDWEFDVEIAEKPEVKLNKYQDAIKSATAKDAIWTPGKDEKPEDEKEKNSKKMNMILETLIKTADIDVPELLIEQEVNHSLSHLLEQVEKLGLKLDQYLASVGKTAEQLRQEYHKASEDNLKLEFILDAIAKDQQFQITDEEVDKLLEKADKETAEIIKKSPAEMANVKYSLIKQKVIDFLMHL
jgi:FKBP-type peptidyl-prolyl cis-trans isomerase (trigger factor)